MNNQNTPSLATDRRHALASPLRLELVGLFTEPGPLSIADMAARTGRPATSLYHHVHVLEAAGFLQQDGTRPKGKRFETLYRLAESRMEVEVETDDESTVQQACQTLSAALRMTERDFAAAFERDDLAVEGPQRNLLGMRVHMRMSPAMLAELNVRLKAVMELLQEYAADEPEPGPDDHFISLTLALAPLRGRRVESSATPVPTTGDDS